MGVSREALEGLRRKYAQMLAMRLAHAARNEEEVDVRRNMSELAARFPGALREIDDLELGDIRLRIAAIEAALAAPDEVEPWMEAVALFHALMRGALCAKRWLARRRRVDAHVEQAYATVLPTLDFPDDARAWAGDLAAIALPPRGRVTDLVFARIARHLGTTDDEARRLVFGLPRLETLARRRSRR